MNGAIQIANDNKFAVQSKRIEGFVVLAATGVAQALTTDTTVYFQKLWIYPGATATNNKINANAAAVYVGNTAQQIVSFQLTSLVMSPDTPQSQSLLAKATYASHGFSTGDMVRISGASDGAFNNTFQITKVDANTFTFTLTDVPAVLAPRGTIVAAGLQAIPAASLVLPDQLNTGDLPLKYELPLGQKQQLSSIQILGNQHDGVFYRIW